MSFPALFDTNVLYGAILNDYILTLADRGLFRPLWSKGIMDELRTNLTRAAEDSRLVEKRVATMKTYFPDAMVEGYESMVDSMTNHPKDRHVLAAAVRGGAEILVTFNLKDFPEAATSVFDIEVVHPDDFLLDQLDLHSGSTLQGLVDLVESYDSPAMTMDDLLLALTRAGTPRFVAAVRDRIG